MARRVHSGPRWRSWMSHKWKHHTVRSTIPPPFDAGLTDLTCTMVLQDQPAPDIDEASYYHYNKEAPTAAERPDMAGRAPVIWRWLSDAARHGSTSYGGGVGSSGSGAASAAAMGATKVWLGSAVWPARYCSHRHRTPCNPRDEGSRVNDVAGNAILFMFDSEPIPRRFPWLTMYRHTMCYGPGARWFRRRCAAPPYNGVARSARRPAPCTPSGTTSISR
jgi:hypothetical protein